MATRRYRCLFVLIVSLPSACHAGEIRTWTDATGTYHVEAEYVSIDGVNVTLRTADGRTIQVPVHTLSDSDRKHLASNSQNAGVRQGNPARAKSETTHSDENDITTHQGLARAARAQREAWIVLDLFEAFLATNDIDEVEKAKARDELSEWQVREKNGAIRVGTQWVTPAELQHMQDDEIRLIKEAHRLIDIKSDELAKEKFLEASKVNPQGVRADFYLGLLNALVAHHPPDAEEHFNECVKRLVRDEDLLTETRRANYVAALNNLAIAKARRRQYREAISHWRTAIKIAPYTPELVQNLGLMVKLANTATYVRIPRGLRTSAGNLYAKITVQNSLGRFDDRVGWLVIPYVDTLDGSMDSSGDEELVTVAWCTGFAVSSDYLLTSRYPLVDADRVVVQSGGNASVVPSGKVVAISNRSNLALIRIDGLQGIPFRLCAVAPKAAQDVLIPGHREPGFTNETYQSRNATIVDLPNLLRHVDTSRFEVGRTGPIYRIAWFNYRDMIMHDAITSAGLEGAPLIDARGRVVGVHIGNRPAFGAYGSKYSLAEPASYAIAFLKPILNDLNVDESTVEEQIFDSQELQKLLKSSIYQLAIQRRAPRLTWSHRIEELHRMQRQGSWTSYEDRTCMACNGRQALDCSNRGCARGTIRKKIRTEVARDERTGSVIYGNKTVYERCPVCNGKGSVRCQYCVNGIDNMLR